MPMEVYAEICQQVGRARCSVVSVRDPKVLLYRRDIVAMARMESRGVIQHVSTVSENLNAHFLS